MGDMKNGPRLLLALILLAHTILGGLYAIYTPPWQVPDEPAHYNYIRALASGRLPVMEPGDYDQAYLERLTGERFPPELPIAPLTYEDHQPPLYYLLAAPLYVLFDGALLPLRLLSVALGGVLLVLIYGLASSLFGEQGLVAPLAMALVAFLPQHLAMTAGVENDILAEVLVAAVLWMAVRYVKQEAQGRQYLIGLGLTVGLGMLAKVSTYVTLPVALLAVALRARRERRPLRTAAMLAGWLLLATALVVGPWLARNVALYGWSDPLGQARHSAVVTGQLRTVEALRLYGWGWLLERFARFTFQSFWGQFGWMGVPLHPPIYLALLILSGLLVASFVGWLLDRQRPRLTPHQVDGLALLGVSALGTVALYLLYNVTFVQHQGRYLFPALAPLALGAALGLDWLLSPRVARWAAAALVGVGGMLLGWGLLRGDLPLLPLGAALGLAALMALAWLLGRWGRIAAATLLALALLALDLYALFGAIVPTLAR